MKKVLFCAPNVVWRKIFKWPLHTQVERPSRRLRGLDDSRVARPLVLSTYNVPHDGPEGLRGLGGPHTGGGKEEAPVVRQKDVAVGLGCDEDRAAPFVPAVLRVEINVLDEDADTADVPQHGLEGVGVHLKAQPPKEDLEYPAADVGRWRRRRRRRATEGLEGHVHGAVGGRVDCAVNFLTERREGFCGIVGVHALGEILSQGHGSCVCVCVSFLSFWETGTLKIRHP